MPAESRIRMNFIGYGSHRLGPDPTSRKVTGCKLNIRIFKQGTQGCRAGAALFGRIRSRYTDGRLLTVKNKPNFTNFEIVLKTQSTQSRMLMSNTVCDFPFKFRSAKTQYCMWDFFWLTHPVLGRSRSQNRRRRRPRKKEAGAGCDPFC